MTRRTVARRYKRAAAALAGLAAVAGLPGAADARTLQQQFAAACSADIDRFCPGLAAGSDEAKACLLRRRSEVDAECLRLVDASE